MFKWNNLEKLDKSRKYLLLSKSGLIFTDIDKCKHPYKFFYVPDYMSDVIYEVANNYYANKIEYNGRVEYNGNDFAMVDDGVIVYGMFGKAIIKCCTNKGYEWTNWYDREVEI